VGVSCALHLQRAGFHVTLLEAGPSVAGRHAASNGNAGTFAGTHSALLFQKFSGSRSPPSTPLRSVSAADKTRVMRSFVCAALAGALAVCGSPTPPHSIPVLAAHTT